MKLVDYNTLAYQFAIRNPRVIELLNTSPNDEVVKELLTFGINATATHFEGTEEITFNSFRELYLDYEHLKHLSHNPHSPFEPYDGFKGYQTLIHPNKGRIFYKKESTEDAIYRIKSLIETRGGKLNRLMNGSAFTHYDAITFFSETVHSIDPTTHTTATIRKDLSFVSEWIKPEKYLQLLPQYIRFTK